MAGQIRVAGDYATLAPQLRQPVRHLHEAVRLHFEVDLRVGSGRRLGIDGVAREGGLELRHGSPGVRPGGTAPEVAFPRARLGWRNSSSRPRSSGRTCHRGLASRSRGRTGEVRKVRASQDSAYLAEGHHMPSPNGSQHRQPVPRFVNGSERIPAFFAQRKFSAHVCDANIDDSRAFVASVRRGPERMPEFVTRQHATYVLEERQCAFELQRLKKDLPTPMQDDAAVLEKLVITPSQLRDRAKRGICSSALSREQRAHSPIQFIVRRPQNVEVDNVQPLQIPLPRRQMTPHPPGDKKERGYAENFTARERRFVKQAAMRRHQQHVEVPAASQFAQETGDAGEYDRLMPHRRQPGSQCCSAPIAGANQRDGQGSRPKRFYRCAKRPERTSPFRRISRGAKPELGLHHAQEPKVAALVWCGFWLARLIFFMTARKLTHRPSKEIRGEPREQANARPGF
jgi:hypothetical protein